MGQVIQFPMGGEALAATVGCEDVPVFARPLELVADPSEPQAADVESIATVAYLPGVEPPEVECSAPVPQEIVEQERPIDTGGERYGASNRLVKLLGSLGVRGLLETPEAQGVKSELYTDVKTKLSEKMSNDPDIGYSLDVQRISTLPTVNGRAVAGDGEAMSTKGLRGLQAAREIADKDPSREFEYVRAFGDQIVMDINDRLKRGESHITISREPVKALENIPDLEENSNYRRGLIYVQSHSMNPDGTITSGTYSVKESDEALCISLAKRLGMDVPEGTPADEFIRHGATQKLTAEETDELIRSSIAEHYESIGNTSKRYSVNEYLEANDHIIEADLDFYMPSFTEAAASGKNNALIQNFAAEIAKSPSENMNPDLLARLELIANADIVSNEDITVMVEILCYAINEKLRPGLVKLAQGEDLKMIVRQTTILQVPAHDTSMSMEARMQAMNASMGSFVQAGIEEGRNAPDCPGGANLKMLKKSKDNEAGPPNPLDVFSDNQAEDKGERKDWFGDKKYSNAKCQSCDKVKLEVGGCHICKDCVGDKAKRDAAWNRQQLQKLREKPTVVQLVKERFEKLAPNAAAA